MVHIEKKEVIYGVKPLFIYSWITFLCARQELNWCKMSQKVLKNNEIFYPE